MSTMAGFTVTQCPLYKSGTVISTHKTSDIYQALSSFTFMSDINRFTEIAQIGKINVFV